MSYEIAEKTMFLFAEQTPEPNVTVELIKAVTTLVTSLAYPTAIIVVFAMLRQQIRSLLEKSTSVEVKVLGSEVKITGKPSELRDVSKIIQPIIQEIDKNIVNLSNDEKALLDQIDKEISAGGKHVVPSDFQRESDLHETYRSLRRRHLVRPKESGTYQKGKEIEITDFGKAVLDLKRPEIFSQNQ